MRKYSGFYIGPPDGLVGGLTTSQRQARLLTTELVAMTARHKGCTVCKKDKRCSLSYSINAKRTDRAYYLRGAIPFGIFHTKSYGHPLATCQRGWSLCDRLYRLNDAKQQLRHNRANAKHRARTYDGTIRLGGDRYRVKDLLEQGPSWKLRLAMRDLGPRNGKPHVSVEVECGILESHTFASTLVANHVAMAACMGGDGSVDVRGRDPVEIRICDSQDKIFSAIDRTCKALADHGAKVNRTCGLHVHIDMRSRDWQSCYRKLYRALPWLYSAVAPSRRRNQYCRRNGAQPEQHSRYYAINTLSVGEHNTLEVRLHHGTVDPVKIKQWIRLLLAVVDGPEVQRVPRDLYGFARRYRLPLDLVAYLATRAHALGGATAEGLRIPPVSDRVPDAEDADSEEY